MKNLVYILIFLFFFACSTAEEVADDDIDGTETEEVTDNDINGDEEEEIGEEEDLAELGDAEGFEKPFTDLEPPFGYESRTVFSLFQDEYRNEQWEMALKYGRYLISEHPKEMENVDAYRGDRMFDRMITIYKEKHNMAEEPELQEAYVDSALQMFDWFFNEYEEDEVDEWRWIMNRGRFYQEHSDYIENGMQKAYEDYATIFNRDVERTTESGDGYYVRIMLQNMKREGETDKVLDWMDRAQPYADEELKAEFDQIRSDIFEDPEERVEWLQTVLDDDPGNVEVMEEIYELYDELGESDKKWDKAREIYETDPSYDNVIRMARLHNDEGDYDVGNEYLRESLELTEDSEQRYETLLRLSRNYQNMRDFEEARDYAERASDQNPDSGEPYIRIADIYSETVSQCTNGDMGRRDRTVYWLVLDYLDKALEVDPGVERQVENRYENFENVMPSSSDKHFMGWETGDSFMIDGEIDECYAWINEETTVR